MIYLVLALQGIDIHCEVQTNAGRIDAVIETSTRIYIVEFKPGTAQEAIDQILRKQYATPYLNRDKQVLLAGVGIDESARNISEWYLQPA